jgi:4a-hydroxytetrahydrobiopterin dehydratase
MEKNIKILSIEEIQEKLKEVPGWDYEDNKISKEFAFESFLGALGFINKIAPFFEAKDHHPDIHIFYEKVLFELTRHSVGGKVTERDFLVAQEIEKAYKKGFKTV